VTGKPDAAYIAKLGIQLLAIGASYFVLAKAALALASINPSASPFWPASGLALAAFLMWGIRQWPAVFAAAFLANLTNAGSLATSLAIASGNTLEGVIGAWLLIRWSGGRQTFDTPAGIARFAGILGLIATPISATIGLVSLLIGGFAEADRAGLIWLTWWLGDFAGATVITPLLVRWLIKGKQSFRGHRRKRTLVLVAATSFVGLIAFMPIGMQSPARHALAFLCIFPLVWAAIYHGRRDTALVAVLLSAFAVWATNMNGGSFAGVTGNDSFLVLVAFMISVCLPSLVLAADVALRKVSERQLRKIQEGLHQRVEKGTHDLAAALAELQKSQANYRLLLDSLRDHAIVLLDAKGNVVSWNSGAARIQGYVAEEIIGRPFSLFYSREDQEGGVPADALAKAAKLGMHETEGWRVRKNGTRFWATTVINAIRDEAGALVGFAKITRDITERLEAQAALDAAREQLLQAQKMDAIGHLTGGVAHDFNNLLMIVSGHAQVLRRKLTESKSLQSVDAIQTAARRGEALTRQLLAFARRQKLTPVIIDLRECIQSVRGMLGSTLREDIQLKVDITPNVWPVKVDEAELELAIVNILVNSRDAMPTGGTITLSLRNAHLDGTPTVAGLTGDFVAVSIEDTGKGIASELLAKVFEPFFTTKEASKGTGLGLSQVYGFARQSDGAVTIESTIGKGTTVTVYLPRSLEEPVKAKPHVPSMGGHRRRTRVLIVEDNAEVMETTASMMQELGHEVVRAAGADDALSRLYGGAGIALVFSDIVMPGSMNGLNLAREIRKRFPDIPVLLTTGYSDAAESAAAEFATLRKPFDLMALDRAMKTALDKATVRAY
jgi:PAS domain S-box-containing protein